MGNRKDPRSVARLPRKQQTFTRVLRAWPVSSFRGIIMRVQSKKPGKQRTDFYNEKKDGSSIYLPIAISRVRIVKLAEKKPDPWRQKIMDRRAKIWKEVTEVTGPKKAKQIEKETGVE